MLPLADPVRMMARSGISVKQIELAWPKGRFTGYAHKIGQQTKLWGNG